jgi:MFS family permease
VRPRLPRNVKVLSAVSFLQDAASEMLYPVMPLFITGTLGAPAAVVGLIEGVAEATASIGKVVSGRLADLRARRPLIALGYGLSSLSKPMIGAAGAWPVVLGARFADRVGKGIRTSPRDALIAADAEPAIRGRAFGFHRAADTAGAVVGPLIGLGLYEALDHELRPLFFFAFIPAALSVGLIWFVREHPRAAAPPEEARTTLRAAATLPRDYWRTVGLLAAFGLVNFADAFLILRAQHLGLGFVSIILVYTLYNIAYAALSYPAGTLSDRVPRNLVFAAGIAVFGIAYLGLGLADSSGWVWVLLPLYGAFTALTDGVGKAWIADLLPASSIGTGLGFYYGITGMCALIAGVWAGLAWDGGTVPLVISGSVALVLSLVVALSPRMSPKGARPL